MDADSTCNDTCHSEYLLSAVFARLNLSTSANPTDLLLVCRKSWREKNRLRSVDGDGGLSQLMVCFASYQLGRAVANLSPRFRPAISTVLRIPRETKENSDKSGWRSWETNTYLWNTPEIRRDKLRGRYGFTRSLELEPVILRKIIGLVGSVLFSLCFALLPFYLFFSLVSFFFFNSL